MGYTRGLLNLRLRKAGQVDADEKTKKHEPEVVWSEATQDTEISSEEWWEKQTLKLKRRKTENDGTDGSKRRNENDETDIMVPNQSGTHIPSYPSFSSWWWYMGIPGQSKEILKTFWIARNFVWIPLPKRKHHQKGFKKAHGLATRKTKHSCRLLWE